VIKAIPVLGAGFRQRRKVGSVCKEDVGPSIAVVIEDRETPGHGFNHVLLRGGAIVEDEGNAALCGDILEMDGSGRCAGELERSRRTEQEESGAATQPVVLPLVRLKRHGEWVEW
jgi:hypothetical protein